MTRTNEKEQEVTATKLTPREIDAKLAETIGCQVKFIPQVKCPKCGMTTSLSRAEEKLYCWGCSVAWVFPAPEAPPEPVTACDVVDRPPYTCSICGQHNNFPTPAYYFAPTWETSGQLIKGFVAIGLYLSVNWGFGDEAMVNIRFLSTNPAYEDDGPDMWVAALTPEAIAEAARLALGID